MNETPMLFPIAPSEFWKQIRTIIDDVVTEKLSQQNLSQTNSHLPDKALLKLPMSVKSSRYLSPHFMNG